MKGFYSVDVCLVSLIIVVEFAVLEDERTNWLSRFNSRMTAAKASGLTPASIICIQVERVFLSKPVLRILEISYMSKTERKVN